jgi:hypothetical protein
MTLESQSSTAELPAPNSPNHQPLVKLRNRERQWRYQVLQMVKPVLSAQLEASLNKASQVADTSLDELADVDLNQVTAQELRPARIRVGLLCVGFSSIALLGLLLYLSSLHSELSVPERMVFYWYEYISIVCLGVAGLFMLGREAMRPQPRPVVLDRQPPDVS